MNVKLSETKATTGRYCQLLLKGIVN